MLNGCKAMPPARVFADGWPSQVNAMQLNTSLSFPISANGASPQCSERILEIAGTLSFGIAEDRDDCSLALSVLAVEGQDRESAAVDGIPANSDESAAEELSVVVRSVGVCCAFMTARRRPLHRQRHHGGRPPLAIAVCGLMSLNASVQALKTPHPFRSRNSSC